MFMSKVDEDEVVVAAPAEAVVFTGLLEAFHEAVVAAEDPPKSFMSIVEL